ncbi:MAG: SH3 domain-containing protein [Treponema sp.]|nr:SH3 domain-containing protein [Treponema sp.]
MKVFVKKLMILAMALSLVCPVFAASKTKTMYVRLESAQLKAKPASSSKKVGTAEYASAVNVLKTEESWSYVQLADDTSVEGWLPNSALTSKKIKDKNNAASADADEIALAGKGFNSTIEAVYAEQFEVNFEVVDYIETLGAATEDAVIFAQEGQLNDGGAE